jgi:hypothetical protein
VKTRGDRVISWVERFCVEPNGPMEGSPVRLSAEQRLTIRKIYDAPGGPYADVPVTGALAAYLTLLHLCGPEALQNKFRGPAVTVDSWSIWRATTPPLQEVLERNGNRIVCLALGTRFPTLAA